MHIAISGTYSTGKSTTSEALSLLTGIPKTKAKTMREIVPEVFPGKMLEECNRTELSRLGLLRFRERLVNEAKLQGDYISDGSCLHEWIYGQGRLRFGLNPKQSFIYSRLRAIVGFRVIAKARNFLHIYGEVAKYHARKEYDVFIHLPVEFPIRDDGHRPISDHFRRYTNELFVDTVEEIGVRYSVVSGTVQERLARIVELLKLPTKMSIDDAVAQAIENVRRETYALEELRRRQRQQYLESLGWWKRLFASKRASE
jgi:nicotinamide riboside kinase